MITLFAEQAVDSLFGSSADSPFGDQSAHQPGRGDVEARVDHRGCIRDHLHPGGLSRSFVARPEKMGLSASGHVNG